MMRSAAKLSYEEAQAAIDGRPSAKCKPLMQSALEPLWAAYRALAQARDRRAPLDLDLPERKIVLDAEGRVERVARPERLEAHRLIEEFMIQANVAAAETLEAKRAPVVYRVHDAPSKEKLAALREFLESLGLKLPGAGALQRRRLQPRAAARQVDAGCRPRQRDRAALAIASRLRRREPRPFRPASCAATRTSPRRSAATPTSSCTARWSARSGSAPAASPTRKRRGSPTSRRPSPMPSGAPWRPSARPPTG